MDRGTLVEADGRPAVQFRRTYPYPPERMWSAIVDPGELAHWFPAAVSLQPRVGGRIEFSGDPHVEARSGTVLAFDPPSRLAYTWGRGELRFDLEADGTGGCTLTLLHVLESPDAAALNAAGWSVCLAELDKHVRGAVANGPHSATAEPWQRYYDRYVAAGMPTGAPIPRHRGTP